MLLNKRLFWGIHFVLVLVILSSLLLFKSRWVFNIDIGNEGTFIAEAQTKTIRNLYGYEFEEVMEGRSFRWTSDWATVSVPFAQRISGPHLLQLTVCACRYDEQPTSFMVTVNETNLITLTATNQWENYIIQLPNNLSHPVYDISVDLRTVTWQSPENRTLGIAVDKISLYQADSAPVANLVSVILVLTALFVLILWRRSLILSSMLVGSWFFINLFYKPQLLPQFFLEIILIIGLFTLWSLKYPIWINVALTLMSLWLVLNSQILGGWLVDDAYISFRYAKNLINNHGLVFNTGEKVEGYTNFLWTMFIALTMKLGADPAIVTVATTLLLSFIIMFLTATIAMCIIPSSWSTMVISLVSVSSPFLLYTVRGSGMETALFTTFILVATLNTLKGNWTLAGLFSALTMLTRPDGVVLVCIIEVYILYNYVFLAKKCAPFTKYNILFTAIFIPYFIWRWSYYGYLLPNTFYVKVGGTQTQFLRGLEYMWNFGINHLILFSGLLGIIIAFFNTKKKRDQKEVLVISITLIYSLYIIAVGGDWMPGFRFAIVLIPFLAISTIWGLSIIANSFTRLKLPSIITALAIFCGLCFILPKDSIYDGKSLVWYENDIVNRYREIGRWINKNTPEHTTIAVSAAGVIPFYADRSTIDILGLNDVYIAHLPVKDLGSGKSGHEKFDPDYVMRRRPDLIPWVTAPYVTKHPDFDITYELKNYRGPEGRTVQLFVRRDTELVNK